MEKKRWIPFLFIGLLLITVIACDISFNNNDEKADELKDFEQQLTLEALQRTQTAVADAAADSQQDTSDSTQDKDADDDSDSSKDTDSSSDDAVKDTTPCNSSKFVSETIKDGTVYQAGAVFTKTWTLRNAGDCDWTTEYKFVFEDGDQMGGASTIKVPSVVKPGGTITFSVDLKAPASSGDYTGVWRLKAADGEKLGKYWVKITVGPTGPPPAAFSITSVNLTTPDTNIAAPGCPIDVPVTAKITSSAAGTATYYFQDSTPASSVPASLTFAGAETKTVTYNVEVNLDDHIGVDLYIDDPNHQWFGPLEFDVVCP